jgi:hypothetical protein
MKNCCWRGESRNAVAIITEAAAATLTAVRTTEPLAPGTSQARGRRAISAPTAAPTVLKMISLKAGSLPGTMVCAISTVVERSRPRKTARTSDRELQPAAIPSGTNRQRFRMPSASQRCSARRSNENGGDERFPDGASVTTRIKRSTVATTSARMIPGRVFNIMADSRRRLLL